MNTRSREKAPRIFPLTNPSFFSRASASGGNPPVPSIENNSPAWCIKNHQNRRAEIVSVSDTLCRSSRKTVEDNASHHAIPQRCRMYSTESAAICRWRKCVIMQKIRLRNQDDRAIDIFSLQTSRTFVTKFQEDFDRSQKCNWIHECRRSAKTLKRLRNVRNSWELADEALQKWFLIISVKESTKNLHDRIVQKKINFSWLLQSTVTSLCTSQRCSQGKKLESTPLSNHEPRSHNSLLHSQKRKMLRVKRDWRIRSGNISYSHGYRYGQRQDATRNCFRRPSRQCQTTHPWGGPFPSMWTFPNRAQILVFQQIR